MENLDFRELVRKGLLPKSAQLLKASAVEGKCITLGEVMSLQTPHVEDNKVVVVDKAVWVALVKGSGVYSCDMKNVCKYELNGNFIHYLVKDRLIPINKINLRNLEEDNKMENKDLQMAEKLASLGSIPGLQDSKTFAVEGEKSFTDRQIKAQENAAKRKDVENTLANEIQGIQSAKLTQLHRYNSINASFLGWITDKDVKIRSFVKKIKVKDEQSKKYKLKAGTDAAIVADFNKGLKVDAKYYETEGHLEFKQDAAGPARYAALRIPAIGYVEHSKLRDPNADLSIAPDAKSEYIIDFVHKDDVPMTFFSYFGKSVKEDERTHDNPSRVVAEIRTKMTTDPNSGQTISVSKPFIYIESKKPLVQARNYFPKTVFRTVKLSKVTEANRDEVNFSLFENILAVNTQKTKSYDHLVSADKELVKEDVQSGKIVSKFLDPRAPQPLNVKDAFTKELIADPAITIKKKVEKLDKTGTRTVLEQYNAALGGEENADLDPFTSGRFRTFLEVCQGELTREKLADLFSTKKGKEKATGGYVTLSAEDSYKLMIKAATEGTTNIVFADKAYSQGSGRIEKLEEQVYAKLANLGSR